jgi:hypothetical protein
MVIHLLMTGKRSSAASDWALAGATNRMAAPSHEKTRNRIVFKLTNRTAITQVVSHQVSSKEKSFYYLFPGPKHGKRRRFMMHMMVGGAAGLIAAGLVAVLVYALER